MRVTIVGMVASALAIIGCGSSQQQYVVEPTPPTKLAQSYCTDTCDAHANKCIKSPIVAAGLLGLASIGSCNRRRDQCYGQCHEHGGDYEPAWPESQKKKQKYGRKIGPQE